MLVIDVRVLVIRIPLSDHFVHSTATSRRNSGINRIQFSRNTQNMHSFGGVVAGNLARAAKHVTCHRKQVHTLAPDFPLLRASLISPPPAVFSYS